jgi:hypothetical protein
VNAWKGRKSSFPIVFAALTWGIAGFACNGILMGSCAMYSQEKQLVWVNCA